MIPLSLVEDHRRAGLEIVDLQRGLRLCQRVCEKRDLRFPCTHTEYGAELEIRL